MWKVTIFSIVIILTTTNAQPVPEPEATTQPNKYYVFSSIDRQAPLPEHAEEVSSHNLPEAFKTENSEHFINKKVVAIPMSKVSSDTKILANDAGHALVAKIEEHSNEIANDNNDDDMETAETLVFRPLFAYRKKQAKRRRIYVPVGYQYTKPYYYENPNRRYYPSYYPIHYHRAQFPVLA